MNKKEELKKRINFLYYKENMTQKEIGELLNISRQRVNAILNSNENHKIKKCKRIGKNIINRKVRFCNNSSPNIAFPKSMLEIIGVNEENKDVEIGVEGTSIVIKRKNK